jgi:hypothetical protein
MSGSAEILSRYRISAMVRSMSTTQYIQPNSAGQRAISEDERANMNQAKMNCSSSGLQAGEIVSPALTSPKEPEISACGLSAVLCGERW